MVIICRENTTIENGMQTKYRKTKSFVDEIPQRKEMSHDENITLAKFQSEKTSPNQNMSQKIVIKTRSGAKRAQRDKLYRKLSVFEKIFQKLTKIVTVKQVLS